jgi:hypothetical protein
MFCLMLPLPKGGDIFVFDLVESRAFERGLSPNCVALISQEPFTPMHIGKAHEADT